MPRQKELDPYLHLRPAQPKSPFAMMRSLHNLTINELHLRTRIPSPTLILAEDGLLNGPLPRLVDYWMSVDPDQCSDIDFQYTLFVETKRHLHRHLFGPHLPIPYTSQSTSELGVTDPHPFDYLRRHCWVNFPPSPTIGPIPPVGPYSMTLTALCRALCLPLDSIKNHVQKYDRKPAVPGALLQALSDIGYKHGDLKLYTEDFNVFKRLKPTPGGKIQVPTRKVTFS